MMSNILTFTLDEANQAYAELRELNVQLDADPLAYGPKRLNSKVSEVRRMLERCERLYLDVSQRLHMVKHSRRKAETDLDLAKKDLFSNDPHVRAGRSIADREAVASGRLLKEIHLLNDLCSTEEGLMAVLTVVKAKRTDLKDTEGRLRDQMRLCSEEMGLGNRWGSKMPSTPDVNLSKALDIQVAPVDEILSGIDGEIHLRQQSGDWTGPGQEEADLAVSVLMGKIIEEPEEEEEEEDEVLPVPLPIPEQVESLDSVLGVDSLEQTVDLDAALKGSATANEVGCFFGDPEAIASSVEVTSKKSAPALDDSMLNDLLSSFEQI